MQSAQIEKQISQDELSRCLTKTTNNIAPSASGFTGPFYKICWWILKHIVLKAVHCIPTNNILPASKQYSIVSVIPKAEKDLLNIKKLNTIDFAQHT